MKEIIDKIISHYDNGIMLLLNNVNNKYIEEIDKAKNERLYKRFIILTFSYCKV